MDIINILSFLIGVFSLLYAIKTYKSDQTRKKRIEEVRILSTSLLTIVKQYKKVNETNISFEIERDLRRMTLFLTDDLQIYSTLLWFYENRNQQDKIIIKNALKLKSFKTEKCIKLAKEIIRSK